MSIEQIRQLAKDESTPTEVLINLATSEDYQTRKSVAANPNTPKDVFDYFIQNPKLGMKYKIAKCINTPICILEILVKERNMYMKIALACNPNLPIPILENLAENVKYKVRINVAANPSTPKHILNLLADDPHPEVRLNVIKNNSTSNATLLRVAENDNEKVEEIKLALIEKELTEKNTLSKRKLMNLIESHYSLPTMERVAKKTYTPAFYLEYLAFHVPIKMGLDRDTCLQTIQKRVASNINASVNTLERLAEHSNRDVRIKARKTLKARFSVSSLQALRS